MTVYRWKPNVPSFWNRLDAQEIGAAIEVLEEEHQHKLTPAEIVRAAADEASPLHAVFEWDDTKAARRYRLEQARNLIQHIDVVLVKADKTEAPIRAFVSVDRPSGRGYVSTVHALSDPELRHQVIQRAWTELEAWRLRHAELTEFGKVFAAIDRARPRPIK